MLNFSYGKPRMCMKNHVIRTRNRNSNLERINKITKTRCSLKKKDIYSESSCYLSIFVANFKCSLKKKKSSVRIKLRLVNFFPKFPDFPITCASFGLSLQSGVATQYHHSPNLSSTSISFAPTSPYLLLLHLLLVF